MTDPLLSIKKLSLILKTEANNLRLISDINFDLERGQCIGIVGESGSGKTMTALAIMQLLPTFVLVSDQSQILFNNTDLLNYSEKEMRDIRGLKIGMVFQDALSAFNPVFTIGQQMQEVLRRVPNHTKTHAIKLLNEVGIDDPLRTYDAYPHQLSGGMRQRAMIAMALCGNPDLIIADEPTTALDVILQAQIIELLKELKRNRKLALLFISHDLAIVSQIADVVMVLKSGAVIEIGTNAQFFRSPQTTYSQALLAAMPSMMARQTISNDLPILLSVDQLQMSFAKHNTLLKTNGKKIRAVDDVTFKLRQGQTFALVGESGSGKTTTALAIIRLLIPDSGHIWFDGKDLSLLSERQLRPIRRDIQMIFQDPYAALNPKMMIAESIMEGMHIQNIIRRRHDRLQRVDELLIEVGLTPNDKWRYPHEFSGGERQRICIARALATSPKLLILDEPTSALDVSIQMQILQLLERLQQQYQLSYLLITHNLSVVAYLAQHVGVMYAGRIIEQGTTDEILNHPKQAYTKKLLAALPILG